MPDGLVDALPDPPTLHQLIVSDAKLLVPPALVQEWALVPTMGVQFQQWLDKFLLKPFCAVAGGEANSAEPKGDDKAPKRKVTGPGPDSNHGDAGEAPAKKMKPAVTEGVMDATNISSVLLKESSVQGHNSSYVQLRAGKEIYIVNKDIGHTTTTITHPAD
eukprot:12405257-Karenia_brevis.AAC.1